MSDKSINIEFLQSKSRWIWQESLKIHSSAPETRIASSLSTIEIFVVLYYGKILRFDPNNINWEHRDRFVISKGHGAISLYPLLADLGFFTVDKLAKVCKEGSNMGSIPDPSIRGFETINGSLGHGLGVACGMALAMKKKKLNSKVFVLTGDGELYEGSIWESVMFASHHKLDNLILIVDSNKISMLDYCRNIIDLEPLEDKFKAFNWETKTVDGHDIESLHRLLGMLKSIEMGQPKVLIANTVKGKGVPCLETDVLCHIKSLKETEVNELLVRSK